MVLNAWLMKVTTRLLMPDNYSRTNICPHVLLCNVLVVVDFLPVFIHNLKNPISVKVGLFSLSYAHSSKIVENKQKR